MGQKRLLREEKKIQNKTAQMTHTADEMRMQSKANVQGKDLYLLHYRGTNMTPPYSDKMSRERE